MCEALTGHGLPATGYELEQRDMANEIQYLHDDAAETLYATVRNLSGEFCNASGDGTFAPFALADWPDYAVALTQVASATGGNVAVQGTFPSAVADGCYLLDIFIRGGASPARTDFRVATVQVNWHGGVLTAADSWSVGALRTVLAVLAGNMSFDESTGEAVFLDAEDGSTPRASYKVSATSVGRSEASVS